MYKLFDEVLDEMIRELGCEAWYERYKKEGNDFVTIYIAEKLGVTAIEAEEYKRWQEEVLNH